MTLDPAAAAASATALPQQRLTEAALRRLRTARPDLAARQGPGPAGAASLLSLRDAVTEEDGTGEVQAVAVLRSFDTATWTRETCAFALGLSPDQLTAWRRSFTRTVFLAGNPENLMGRFTFDHVAADGSAAWCGPAPAAASTGLRRLLKLFDVPATLSAGTPATVVRIPGTAAPGRAATHRDLYVATAGLRLPRALVHLNHLLAEAVTDGLIAPGDLLRLRHVPRLIGLSTPLAAVRVDADPHAPDRLTAFAGLTEPVPGDTEPVPGDTGDPHDRP